MSGFFEGLPLVSVLYVQISRHRIELFWENWQTECDQKSLQDKEYLEYYSWIMPWYRPKSIRVFGLSWHKSARINSTFCRFSINLGRECINLRMKSTYRICERLSGTSEWWWWGEEKGWDGYKWFLQYQNFYVIKWILFFIFFLQ